MNPLRIVTRFSKRMLGIPTYAEIRSRRILAHIKKDGIGLEIGPSHCPVAPRKAGFNVKVMDCVDKEGLIRKYTELGTDTENIEDVDYVWNGEKYADLVGGTEKFDWIISSHSIEHVPDMVGFLLDCKEILKIGGVISLAVPNRRSTFDALRGDSSLSAVIDAHLRGDKKPTPGGIAEFNICFATARETYLNRLFPSLKRFHRINTPEKVRAEFRKGIAASEYIDIHVWTFTPESFVSIFTDLRTLGLIEGMEIIAPPIDTKDEFLLSIRRTT